MKATPLAQYLEQKSRGSGYDWPSARRESVTPVAAGPAVVSYEQRAQAASVFRRSNLANASPPSPTPSEAEPASASPIVASPACGVLLRGLALRPACSSLSHPAASAGVPFCTLPEL